MVLDINVSLFDNTKCTNFFQFFRRQPSQKYKVKEIIKDINVLLESQDFNREYLCNHLLNKACQLTCSEYGFIGVIKSDTTKNEHTQYLKTLAISNISWNASSFEFYKKFVNDSFEFTDLPKTIFGLSILNKKPVIINKYDATRNVLPPGHPPIKRFLGIPIIINDTVMLYVGLCNKIGFYTKKDYKMIERVLNIVGISFYIMSKFSQEKSVSELKGVKKNKNPCPILNPQKGVCTMTR